MRTTREEVQVGKNTYWLDWAFSNLDTFAIRGETHNTRPTKWSITFGGTVLNVETVLVLSGAGTFEKAKAWVMNIRQEIAVLSNAPLEISIPIVKCYVDDVLRKVVVGDELLDIEYVYNNIDRLRHMRKPCGRFGISFVCKGHKHVGPMYETFEQVTHAEICLRDRLYRCLTECTRVFGIRDIDVHCQRNTRFIINIGGVLFHKEYALNNADMIDSWKIGAGDEWCVYIRDNDVIYPAYIGTTIYGSKTDATIACYKISAKLSEIRMQK
jgi:hypothetical protein